MKLLLSKRFVDKFKVALLKLYKYDKYMDFVVVPSISGQKALAYLPLLNYTDRGHDEVDDLLELAKDNNYQIRTLNFSYDDFKEHDTVTMRVDIDEKSSEQVFTGSVKSRCRNKIRNANKKFDYDLKYGNSAKDIEAFYEVFSETMYKHGTPVFSKQLFYLLAEEFADEIIFFNLYDNSEIVATMCILLDEHIAWYPWGGVKSDYANKLAGYKIYWEVLAYICDKTDKKIFDFGRSSFGGSTYRFKSQFGAEPVKIDILTSQQDDIYEKYSFAAQIWKKLPKGFVDFLGPKLCKYLVDL
jgi:hypothetical protein